MRTGRKREDMRKLGSREVRKIEHIIQREITTRSQCGKIFNKEGEWENKEKRSKNLRAYMRQYEERRKYERRKMGGQKRDKLIMNRKEVGAKLDR